MYLRINNDEEEVKYYVTLQYFTTQHGKEAVRFIGADIPETHEGFKYYDDNDKIFVDLSDYIYQYKTNEYSIEEDIIQYGTGSNDPLPPSSLDSLNRQIKYINKQVIGITPYTKTKQLYIDDSEVIFTNVPNGVITVSLIDKNGNYIPYTIEREDANVKIAFEALQEKAIITISVER